MADDVNETIERHAETLAEHGEKIAQMQEASKNMGRLIDQHDTDIENLKTIQAKMATSDDVKSVSDKVDTSVNGLLRDALNAVPGMHANTLSQRSNRTHRWLLTATWAGILLSFAGLLFAIVHGAG